ncbi:MAG: hypothetical protein ABIH39_03510, partial [Candidatus Margulisiibacteriota bacterium]
SILFTIIKYDEPGHKIIINGTDSSNGSAVGVFLQELQNISDFQAVDLEYLRAISGGAKEFKIIGKLK